MTLDIVVALIVVLVLALFVSKFLRLSPKYDRKPRERNAWQKLDHGDDPTVEQ